MVVRPPAQIRGGEVRGDWVVRAGKGEAGVEIPKAQPGGHPGRGIGLYEHEHPTATQAEGLPLGRDSRSANFRDGLVSECVMPDDKQAELIIGCGMEISDGSVRQAEALKEAHRGACRSVKADLDRERVGEGKSVELGGRRSL